MNYPTILKKVCYPKLYKITVKINIIFNCNKIVLLDSEEKAIESIWAKAKRNNKTLFNGKTFSCVKVIVERDCIKLYMGQTTYAHYLFSKEYGKPFCRGIAIGALLITSDNYIILGKMSEKTSFPNMVQCIGGGIDIKDINNNLFSLDSTLRREVIEETGLDILLYSSQCEDRYVYVRENMSFFCFINVIELKIDKKSLNHIFEEYKNKSHKNTELTHLISIKKNAESINRFTYNETNMVDYLSEIFNAIINKTCYDNFEDFFVKDMNKAEVFSDIKIEFVNI